METYDYQLTKTAKADIEGIGKYIADNFYVETAISIVEEIDKKIGEICEFPLAYRARELFSDRYGEIRIAVAKNYNIYFAVDKEIHKVYIVRVAHCSMNLVQEFVEGEE
jgi:plasmid stabilization system protein ParE